MNFSDFRTSKRKYWKEVSVGNEATYYFVKNQDYVMGMIEVRDDGHTGVVDDHPLHIIDDKEMLDGIYDSGFVPISKSQYQVIWNLYYK